MLRRTRTGDQMRASRASTILSILWLWAGPSLGQQATSGPPTPGVKGPEGELAIGYSYVGLNFSGKPRVNLNGVDASAAIEFSPRWGATFDSSYVRGGRDPGSRHSTYLLSLLTGPTFVAAQSSNTRLLLRALAGVSLVDGSIPVNQLYYRGWLSRFTWAAGTGIERSISPPFAIRINVDYLRTKYVSSALVVQPQNNIRLSGSLVFRFTAHREARHAAARQR